MRLTNCLEEATCVHVLMCSPVVRFITFQPCFLLNSQCYLFEDEGKTKVGSSSFKINYVCVCVCVCTTGGGRLFPPTQVFRLLPSELSHLLQGNPLFHSHSLLSSLSEVNNSLHTLSISCSAWGRSSPNNWRQLCKSLYFPAFTASKCIDRLLGVSFSHEDSRNCRFAIS